MAGIPDIAPALKAALAARGYETLTPVQQAMLDPELGDRDVLVSAQTGSGKTVAFGIAMAGTLLEGENRLPRADAPLALVVAPTRELALQVRREIEWLYAEAGAILASCVGGMDARAERRALERGAHIVVGTPGRLRDHIERGTLDMTMLRAVVLDEADEMLDLGFREDLEFILGSAPEERRTLLFSATVPKAIAGLAKKFQKDAARIVTREERSAHADIEYRAYAVAQSDRENAIYNILRYNNAESALVFCSTRAAVNHLTARFSNRGFSVVALSGELSQQERSQALQAMRDGRARVCVATDVAARGIDLPTLELVIHADLPNNRETLLHRSGRTGRAGRKGISALIATNHQKRKAERLLSSAGVSAEWDQPPGPAEIQAKDDERILTDPALEAPMADDERHMVAALLEKHGAEKLATAFLRHLRSGMAAAEELIDVKDPAAVRPPRDAFGPSRWFTLSVGRRQNAEPRWLLPMICGKGGLGRGDVGAIRMARNITHVEIAAAKADNFLKAVGPEMVLEDGITVTAADGPPPAEETRAPKPHRGGGGGKKDFGDGGPKRRPKGPGKKKSGPRD